MLTHEHKGRLWVEIGSEPYRRKDGSETELIVWATRCAAEGCTEVVEIKTPATGYEKSKAFDAKHCPAHKLTKEETARRRGEAIKARRASR